MIVCCANPCKTDCGSEKSVDEEGSIQPLSAQAGTGRNAVCPCGIALVPAC